MYDALTEILLRTTRKIEEAQLSEMFASLPQKKGVSNKGMWIIDVTQKAAQLGIACGVTELRPTGSDKNHQYIVFSTDANAVKALRENKYKDLDTWITRTKQNGRGIVVLDKVAFDVTELNRHNYLQLNSLIMRQVQDMSIAKQAFLNEGYPVPDHVSEYIVHSIWELDHMRSNKGVNPELRKRYEQTYKNAVADYAQMYAKKFKDVLNKLPHQKNHLVKESYFKENHIACVWEAVPEPFFEYIQEQLRSGRYPEFIYYKPDKAFLKTKNLAEAFAKTKQKGINFWEKDTGKTKYYFCFPVQQEHIFYTLMNEYNAKTLQSQIKLEEIKTLEAPERPLQLIYVHQYDLPNWNRLCEANNVRWSIDDGSVSKIDIKAENAKEKIPIIYPYDDIKTVSGITARLTKEMRDYDPVSDVTKGQTRQRCIQDYVERLEQRTERNPGVSEINL